MCNRKMGIEKETMTFMGFTSKAEEICVQEILMQKEMMMLLVS